MSKSINKAELQAMLDPRYAKIISDSLPRDSAGTLILLAHEYVGTAQQENLFLELDHFFQMDPTIPIFLEGFSGPRAQWLGTADGEELKTEGGRGFFHKFAKSAPKADSRDDPKWRASQASRLFEQKGTLASSVVTKAFPPHAALFGAEDGALLKEQKSQLAVIDALVSAALLPRRIQMGARGLFESVFSSVLDPIVKNLEAHLNAGLRQLLDLRGQYRRDGRATVYAAKLAELAGPAGIDLQGYPSVQALTTAMRLEASIDFRAVNAERLALVNELARRSGEPLDEEQEKAVRRWLDYAPTEEKVFAGVYGEGPGADLGMAWLARLVVISQAYRDRKYSYSQYHLRLKDLMDALRIDCPETTNLGKYFRYVALAEQHDLNALVSSELGGLHDELADLATTSAIERGVLKLGTECEDLFKFMMLRLPAHRVQTFMATAPSVGRWLEDAIRLEGSIPGVVSDPKTRLLAKNSVPIFEAASPAIKDFYSLGLRRSIKLVENVLRSGLVAGRTAALVCGRFHLHEIRRVLQNQPKLGWAVISPMPARLVKDEGLQFWNWIFPTHELALSEAFGDLTV